MSVISKQHFVSLLCVTALAYTIASGPALCADLPGALTAEETLAREIRIMIDAGHLSPGLSLFEQHYQFDNFNIGWNFDDYWHNPAELVYTLAIAMPHLPEALRPEARAYLRAEYERFPPYEFIHMGSQGAHREPSPPPSTFGSAWAAAYRMEAEPVRNANWTGWSFNPFNAYACYKYAQLFPNSAGPALQALRDKMQRFPSDVEYLSTRPHVLNAYIAGYNGYLGLQDMMGEQRSAQVEAWLRAALQARIEALSVDPRKLPAGVAGGFIWLTPELGDFLHANARDKVQAAVQYQSWAAPYWFIARAQETTRVESNRVFSEGYFAHIYEYMSQFQVRAWALKWPREELENYLDVPSVPRGDLYFIQNLVATIQAGAPSSGGVRTNRDRRYSLQGNPGEAR